MRVVFMGTPDFAVPTLARLAEDGHAITAVYTRAPARGGPRAAARGRRARTRGGVVVSPRASLALLTKTDQNCGQECMHLTHKGKFHWGRTAPRPE